MSFLNFNKSPVTYGAIMYNGSPGGGTSSCYPFFTSQFDLTVLTSISSTGSGTISIADIDDYWTVMPGYKLLVYAGQGYTNTVLLSVDNSGGVAPATYAMNPNYNLASSVQLYFKGNLINDPSPIRLIATNYITTYVVAYNSVNYRVYEFIDSTGTFSVPEGSSSVNILGLLVGGGGGGGFTTSLLIDSGGGGAGTFLTTTITATPGSTFNVTVGNGGAQDTAGYPTSITRMVNTVIDASLNAGGGGSGGTITTPTGTVNTYFGSTGGARGAGIASRVTGTAYTVTAGSTVFTNITASVTRGGSGGSGATAGAGGGGGAGVAGTNGAVSASGTGGNGLTWAVINMPTRYFGGGGAGSDDIVGGAGGGGGWDSALAANNIFSPRNATANTGGGGGGYGTNYSSTYGNGGSGICIIAVPL